MNLFSGVFISFFELHSGPLDWSKHSTKTCASFMVQVSCSRTGEESLVFFVRFLCQFCGKDMVSPLSFCCRILNEESPFLIGNTSSNCHFLSFSGGIASCFITKKGPPKPHQSSQPSSHIFEVFGRAFRALPVGLPPGFPGCHGPTTCRSAAGAATGNMPQSWRWNSCSTRICWK